MNKLLILAIFSLTSLSVDAVVFDLCVDSIVSLNMLDSSSGFMADSILMKNGQFQSESVKSLPTITAPDMAVTPNMVGQVIEVPVTLNMPDGDDFTNIQLIIQFPDGLEPINVNGSFLEHGGGIPLRGGSPLLFFADNLNTSEFWPEFTIISYNGSQKPVDTNPCHICTLFVTAQHGYEAGHREMRIWCKYVKSDGSNVEIGQAVSGRGGNRSISDWAVLNTFNFVP